MKVSHRFVVVTAIFITCLITANIIVIKPTSFGGIPAAIVIFPLSYIVGDILTEVYGYSLARRVIWLGFLCNLLAVIAIWIGQLLPPAPEWGGQEAYKSILGYTPQILGASVLAYAVGEFSNSFVLAKMKIKTKGRWLWTRTIGSTMVAQALDAAVFIPLVYIVRFDLSFIAIASLTHWAAKVVYEAAATPLTYTVVNYLKKKEAIDTYDYETKFNPFLVWD
ncbi:MAG: queuosine precursor transporter [Dehalococcoidia bacterium]|nr:queuosine precursor transporter [Dehalococcoidia bacterium]